MLFQVVRFCSNVIKCLIDSKLQLNKWTHHSHCTYNIRSSNNQVYKLCPSVWYLYTFSLISVYILSRLHFYAIKSDILPSENLQALTQASVFLSKDVEHSCLGYCSSLLRFRLWFLGNALMTSNIYFAIINLQVCYSRQPILQWYR